MSLGFWYEAGPQVMKARGALAEIKRRFGPSTDTGVLNAVWISRGSVEEVWGWTSEAHQRRGCMKTLNPL